MKQLSHKVVYENHWNRVWEDDVAFSDGKLGKYAYIDRIDSGAIMIPLDGDGNLYFIKEYRYPVQTDLWTFPAGGREGDETAEQAGRRELKEEAGITGKIWTLLNMLFCDPAQSMQRISLFLVEDLDIVATSHEHSESIEVHKMSLEDMKKRINEGEPASAQFLACLFLLEQELNRRTQASASQHPPPVS